jgi:hypothetical protein
VEVYGQEPDYTREGGSIPVTLDFANILGLNVLLLPVGRGDDGAHSTNEKLDTSNYINVGRASASHSDGMLQFAFANTHRAPSSSARTSTSLARSTRTRYRVELELSGMT